MEDLNIKVNDRIEVLVEEKPYKSLIIDIDDDFLMINLPVNDGEYLMLYKGDTVEINCYIENSGYFNFFADVICKEKEDNILCYKLTPPYNATKIQRRNFFRVNLIKFIGYKNITNVEEEEIQNIPFEEGLMIDLSGGGIKLKLKEDLEKDSVIIVKIFVKDQEMILKGNIVRVENTVDGQKIYGVKFIDITQRQCDKIIEELFEIMRKQRAKN